MDRGIKKLTHQLARKPRTLFLIDSLGALLTALFLFVILRHFSPYIGMPKTVLGLLCMTAACFFLYSAACFLLVKEKWAFFIRLISFANALYCLVNLILIGLHYKGITNLGLAYFAGETAIICALVYIEFHFSAKI